MPSARYAIPADAAAWNTHLTRVVSGQTIIQELALDFGEVSDLSSSGLQVLWQMGVRGVMGFDDANVLRCVILARPEADGWEVILIAADKRLNATQRLAAMRFLLGWISANTPPATRIFGVVKIGGRIDTFMTGKLSGRIDLGTGFVRFETTSQELAVAVA